MAGSYHRREDQDKSEGHASASDDHWALIREDQRRQAKRELEAKLLEGLHGSTVEMTREDWESIRREALRGLADEPIRP